MSTGTAQGQMNRTPIAPATPKSPQKQAGVYSDKFGPVSRAMGFARNRNNAIGNSVATLSVNRRPLNVTDFVMTVIVDPVKRMSRRRAESYFGKKLLERCESKFDAASFIRLIARIVAMAPLFGQIVRRQLGRFTATGGMPMGRPNAFPMETSARLSMAATQVAASYADNVTANALTEPCGSLWLRRTSISENGQTAELLTCAVNEAVNCWMRLKNNGIFVVVQGVFSSTEKLWARLGSILALSVRAVLILLQSMQMRVIKTDA